MTLPKDPQKVQEYRDKLSKALKIRWTPEERAKQSERLKFRFENPEKRAKLSKTNKGQIRSVKIKQKMSISAKARCTPEYRKKMSLIAKANGVGAIKGHIHSPETRLKISQSHKANWEGIPRGVDLDDFNRSCWENEKWRKAVLEHDNYTCQYCGQIRGELNAHHIFLWSTHPLFRFLLWNGKTLCLKCHKKVHSKKEE